MIDNREGDNWLVAMLIMRRPFDKDALFGTMRGVWRFSRAEEISKTGDNLFLFNFDTKKDKQCVMEGSP